MFVIHIETIFIMKEIGNLAMLQ